MRHREGLSPTQELMLEGFERRVGRFLGVENGLTPGGPLPVRWEPPEGSRGPRVGDHSDGGGTWKIREGAEVNFPPEDIEEKVASYGAVAIAKAHQLTVGKSLRRCLVPEREEAYQWRTGVKGSIGGSWSARRT